MRRYLLLPLAQRRKTWDGGDYTTGDGPQNDAVRIYHYVRPVRDA